MPPLSEYPPTSREISAGRSSLPEHQKFACSPGSGAKSFKFLRKRPRAHAGETRAFPAEESLKNDDGASGRSEGGGEKSASNGVLSGSRIAGKFSRRSRPKLSSNYRQTIVATDLVFGPCSIRRAENLPELRSFASLCIFAQRNFHFNSSVCFSRRRVTVLCSRPPAPLLNGGYRVGDFRSRATQKMSKNS